MKTEWSRSWVASKQPRKQRKYRFNAPLHIKHGFLSAHLSKELRQKYGKRNIPVRKGDKVKVMRGKFDGTIGEVDQIFMRKSKIHVRGVEIKKRDGTKRNVPIDPSNVMIISLKLDDKLRVKALERKAKVK